MLIFMVALWVFSPLADLLTGYLIFSHKITEGAVFTPSQLFRAVLTLLSIIIILFHPKKEFKIYWSLSFLSLLFVEMVSLFFYHASFYFFLQGFVNSVKLIFVFLVAEALIISLKDHQKNLSILIFSLSCAVLMIGTNVFISYFFDIGEKTYGYGKAAKGFIASGNGLSIWLCVTSLLLLEMYRFSEKKYLLVISLFSCFAMVLVGTKASILGLLIYIFFVTFPLKIKTKFQLAAIVALLLVSFKEIIISNFSVILQRFNNSDNVFKFFASGRDLYFSNAMNSLLELPNYFERLLTGGGAFLSSQNIAFIRQPKLIENDVLDLFFKYGIIGLAVYCLIFIRLLYVGFRSQSFILFTACLLLMGYSMIAGHTLMNGMVAGLLGTLYAVCAIYADVKTANKTADKTLLPKES